MQEVIVAKTNRSIESSSGRKASLRRRLPRRGPRLRAYGSRRETRSKEINARAPRTRSFHSPELALALAHLRSNLTAESRFEDWLFFYSLAEDRREQDLIVRRMRKTTEHHMSAIAGSREARVLLK